MSTSKNPNGYIAIVFTYNGNAMSYEDFLKRFNVTLPGGGGVKLGDEQYYAQGSQPTKTLTLGTSYPLNTATSTVDKLLPTNVNHIQDLRTAFQYWAAHQAASSGQTEYANLYLSHYTGGRVYLSNGNLDLSVSGEPTPAAPTDSAYNLIYGIIEPFIGSQVGSSTVPGNLVDITDIDWFSFPISLKVWSYDFKNSPGRLIETGYNKGGNGNDIYNALLISGSSTEPTNLYPDARFPAENASTSARRLIGPTMAAAPSSYYTDPAQSPFPYHLFDDYLIYLQSTQAGAQSLFTLSGEFAGVGKSPSDPNVKPQSFSFAIDFSHIKTKTVVYPKGSVLQITPDSAIMFTGYTGEFGSEQKPFTITVPWAMGKANYSLSSNTNPQERNDAIKRGWLSMEQNVPTGVSGTYSALHASAYDSSQNELAPANQTITSLQLIYSVNREPLGTNKEDLFQGGQGKAISISNANGLKNTPSAIYTQVGTGDNKAVLTITTDIEGNISTVLIDDTGVDCTLYQRDSWIIPAQAVGLGNNQSFTVTLMEAPKLRNVFVLNSATYPSIPVTLSITPPNCQTVSLHINPAGLQPPSWKADESWTTLCQPAGIYGANSGYSLAGLTGANSIYNGDIKSLQNDVFGWVVADLLAALNTGLVGATVDYPPTGKPLGKSPEVWFNIGDNPYTKGLWGAKAWEGQTNKHGKSITNFWNTWAYELYSVPGGTDAYNFPFTDRFEKSVLLGFDPPSTKPTTTAPVLLEVIVDDSPFLSS